MLTEKQEQWINHLSDTDTVKVFPYDPTSAAKFEEIKMRIQAVFNVPIEHHGASSLGISGQNEIDAYIPADQEHFEEYVERLKNLFGQPGSHYPLERARFKTDVDGKRVDVFVINKESEGWNDSVIFSNYLRSHPEALEEYRILKESLSGKTVREYYRGKIEFINEIVAKALFR